MFSVVKRHVPTTLKKGIRKTWDILRQISPVDIAWALFDSWRGKPRTTVLTIGNIPIKLRAGTSDEKVAKSVLQEGELQPLSGLSNIHTIIDGGANIGVTALAFAEMFPGATIIAIEPEDENFALLQENTKQNNNIITLNCALASCTGEQVLLDRNTGPWGYCLSKADDAITSRRQTVKCRTLDDIVNEYSLDSIDILKLDIEGGEKDVLESSGGWIDLVRVLVAELHDRITPGCSRAFDKATAAFDSIKASGEKQIAYRSDAYK